MLRRQRAIEIVPASEPFRRRRYDVPQHLAPETSDALRFCAVEGDLDLLARRHQPTIKAGCWNTASDTPAKLASRSCRAPGLRRGTSAWAPVGHVARRRHFFRAEQIIPLTYTYYRV